MGAWIAVVGSWQEGRDDVLRSLVQTLQAAPLDVGGFVQTTMHDADGVSGFDVTSVASGTSVPLARKSDTPDLCDWGFRPEGFEQARAWMLDGRAVVCFAEAGRIEAGRRGHWPAILRSLDERPITVVGIRRSVLSKIALELPDPVDAIELPAPEDEVQSFLLRVRRLGVAASQK